MRSRRSWTVVVLIALLACGSGLAMWHHAAGNRRTGASARARHGVVAGTSMIACALQSLAGESLEVHLLAPPGQCPGHFDLKPADFRAILRSRTLFRHDYQAHLDEKLKASGEARTVVELTTAGPQTIPENYLALCEDATESLCALFPELRPRVNRRLNRLRDSIARTSAEIRRRAAPLAGLPVVASTFQEEFCRWLGMRVVGRFDRAEEMGLRELQELIARGRKAGAVAVVGNLQRGTREGEPVARALGVPLALLSNFPLEPHRPDAYPHLLEGNVSKLLETCHAREGR